MAKPIHLVLSFFCLMCSISCSGAEDKEKAQARAAIAETTRNPDTAKFKNERIRLLWTKGGERLKVYCADVNAENAFGGWSGYKPATFIFSAKITQPIVKDIFTPGKVWINEKMSDSYYMRCVREDTERTHDTIGAIFLMDLWQEDRSAEIDREIPPISRDLAPELR